MIGFKMISLDKTYKTKSGSKVIIHAIYPYNEMQQVQGAIDYNNCTQMNSWSLDGRFHEGTTDGSSLDLVEVSPYEDWKIDDKVIVTFADDEDEEGKYYFAGLNKSNLPCVFKDGRTSWSNIKPILAVTNIRKAEEQ
jgi:hypothetical protein